MWNSVRLLSSRNNWCIGLVFMSWECLGVNLFIFFVFNLLKLFGFDNLVYRLFVGYFYNN